MREILFRGKRKDNNEWVYGYYSPCIWYPSKKQTPSIKELPYGNDVEIISETVCQYTGLTDINGKKIFEGDVVKDHKKYSSGKTYTVCFGKHSIKCCGCCYESHETIGFYLDGYKDDEETWDKLEVVGNIYQPKVEVTVVTNTGTKTMEVNPWEVDMVRNRALIPEGYVENMRFCDMLYQSMIKDSDKNGDH